VSTLLIFKGETIDRTVPLPDGDVRIGRGTQNDVVLEDPGKSVSRFHAELRFENGQFWILDLNSQNGTWVDGERIQKVRLSPGMPVVIGAYRLLIEAGAADAQPSTVARMPSAPSPQLRDASGASRAAIERLGPSGSGTRPGVPPPGRLAARRARVPAGPTKPRTGLLAWIASQPKPVVFGGFGVLIVGVLMLGPLLRSGEMPGTSQTPPPLGGDSNRDYVDEHLARARALIRENQPEVALREHILPVLARNPDEPHALDLKAEAETLRASTTGPPVAPPVPTTETATHPGVPTGPASDPKAPPTSGDDRPMPVTGPLPVRATSPVSRPTKIPQPAEPTTADRPAAGGGPSQATTSQPETQRALAQVNEALAARRYDEAQQLLRSMSADNPRVATLLQALREASAGDARTAMDSGRQLETAGDLAGAIKQYERAAQLSPDVDADGTIRRARERMRALGEDAYKRARQYDALRRVNDAITQYQRAIEYLPAGDPMRQAAIERLAVLRPGQP